MAEFHDLRAAAIALSDALHSAEVNGFELPGNVDRAWLRLSVEIQNTSPMALATKCSEQSGDVRKSETPQGGVGAQMPRDGSTPSAAHPHIGEQGPQESK